MIDRRARHHRHALAVQSTTKRWLARRLRLVDSVVLQLRRHTSRARSSSARRCAGSVTIRAKLYTAIVVVLAGLALTASASVITCR